MSLHMSRFRASAIILLLLLATGAAGQQPSPSSTAPVMRSAYGEKLKLAGLPNGGRINVSLYRGAQPHPNGLTELKKMGITTDRKSTRLNSSHIPLSRMQSSA